MIALIVVAAIIVLVFLLLFLPLTMDLVYDGDLFIKLKYLGITVFDDQKSEEKERKKAKKQKKKTGKSTSTKDENFLLKTYKQKGLFGTISYCCGILKIVIQNIPNIAKRFKFRKLKFDLTVATDDAADTAIRYGEYCAVLYPTISLLQSVVDLKPSQINICADFDKTETEFKGSVLAKASVIYWIIIVYSMLKEIENLKYKESEENERKQSKDRNGHNDGKTSRNG